MSHLLFFSYFVGLRSSSWKISLCSLTSLFFLLLLVSAYCAAVYLGSWADGGGESNIELDWLAKHTMGARASFFTVVKSSVALSRGFSRGYGSTDRHDTSGHSYNISSHSCSTCELFSFPTSSLFF